MGLLGIFRRTLNTAALPEKGHEHIYISRTADGFFAVPGMQ
jgi:hypothetical protein